VLLIVPRAAPTVGVVGAEIYVRHLLAGQLGNCVATASRPGRAPARGRVPAGRSSPREEHPAAVGESARFVELAACSPRARACGAHARGNTRTHTG
jgi:hypothetical protein